MKIKRRASVLWTGGFEDGRGAVSTASGALSAYPYGYASRFGDLAGTNPEELLGAAHAACFTMAVSLALSQADLTAESLETHAEVTIESVGEGYAITAVHLALTAKIPGAEQASFDRLVGLAKAECPVSKALNVEITLTATLLP